MCSCVISQRNHDFGADTQIKKKLRWFSFEFLRVRRKITSTPSYAYLRICLFSKVITALGCDSLSVEVKNIDVGTLLAFLFLFFFFFRWRPMFSSYLLCVFFCVGPSASMHVCIILWTHRYFFTCNNFT
jgi:hypothetical protein